MTITLVRPIHALVHDQYHKYSSVQLSGCCSFAADPAEDNEPTQGGCVAQFRRNWRWRGYRVWEEKPSTLSLMVRDWNFWAAVSLPNLDDTSCTRLYPLHSKHDSSRAEFEYP